MADVSTTPLNVEKLDEPKRNSAVEEIEIDSSHLGIYDRPNSTTNARNNALMMIIFLVSLLVLVYILFRGLA